MPLDKLYHRSLNECVYCAQYFTPHYTLKSHTDIGKLDTQPNFNGHNQTSFFYFSNRIDWSICNLLRKKACGVLEHYSCSHRSISVKGILFEIFTPIELFLFLRNILVEQLVEGRFLTKSQYLFIYFTMPISTASRS